MAAIYCWRRRCWPAPANYPTVAWIHFLFQNYVTARPRLASRLGRGGGYPVLELPARALPCLPTGAGTRRSDRFLGRLGKNNACAPRQQMCYALAPRRHCTPRCVVPIYIVARFCPPPLPPAPEIEGRSRLSPPVCVALADGGYKNPWTFDILIACKRVTASISCPMPHTDTTGHK